MRPALALAMADGRVGARKGEVSGGGPIGNGRAYRSVRVWYWRGIWLGGPVS